MHWNNYSCNPYQDVKNKNKNKQTKNDSLDETLALFSAHISHLKSHVFEHWFLVNTSLPDPRNQEFLDLKLLHPFKVL